MVFQLAEMMAFVAELGLNTHELDYRPGDHTGCW
jgi:hypothetical protein